jgi:ankyrin repeat protein
VEIIKILLYKGMPVDLKNANDSRPLHFSASKGNLEVKKALVERGAPLNNANKNGAIPLILGARYDKIEVFHYLTQIGSDINIPDAEKTLLFTMLLFLDIVEIIKMLHR